MSASTESAEAARLDDNVPRSIRIDLLDWRGWLIEVRYEMDWLGCDCIAHLELETIEPARGVLPVTETGYRSCFVTKEEIEHAGGPLAYVEGWLNAEVGSSKWRELEFTSRQFSLF